MLKITPLNWVASLNILKNAAVLGNKGNKAVTCELKMSLDSKHELVTFSKS